MNLKNKKAIAAAAVATIAVSICMGSCQGRKMSNMEPTGETVEVVVGSSDETDSDIVVGEEELSTDSIE